MIPFSCCWLHCLIQDSGLALSPLPYTSPSCATVTYSHSYAQPCISFSGLCEPRILPLPITQLVLLEPTHKNYTLILLYKVTFCKDF
jgi:hypothetical protein